MLRSHRRVGACLLQLRRQSDVIAGLASRRHATFSNDLYRRPTKPRLWGIFSEVRGVLLTVLIVPTAGLMSRLSWLGPFIHSFISGQHHYDPTVWSIILALYCAETKRGPWRKLTRNPWKPSIIPVLRKLLNVTWKDKERNETTVYGITQVKICWKPQ